MAPELLLGRDYNETIDVFSFGECSSRKDSNHVVCSSARPPFYPRDPKGILLCELIGRIEADPDIMPRTNAFGIDEEVFRFVAMQLAKWILTGPTIISARHLTRATFPPFYT